MPTYDFRCEASHCPREGKPFEARLPMADRDAHCVYCPDCAAIARRLEVPTKAPMCVMMRKLETSDKQIPERMLP